MKASEVSGDRARHSLPVRWGHFTLFPPITPPEGMTGPPLVTKGPHLTHYFSLLLMGPFVSLPHHPPSPLPLTPGRKE